MVKLTTIDTFSSFSWTRLFGFAVFAAVSTAYFLCQPVCLGYGLLVCLSTGWVAVAYGLSASVALYTLKLMYALPLLG